MQCDNIFSPSQFVYRSILFAASYFWKPWPRNFILVRRLEYQLYCQVGWSCCYCRIQSCKTPVVSEETQTCRRIRRWPCTLLPDCYPTSTRICVRCMAPCSYKRTNAISRKYPAACATNNFWQQFLWFLNRHISTVAITACVWSASRTVRVIVPTNSSWRFSRITLSFTSEAWLTSYWQIAISKVISNTTHTRTTRYKNPFLPFGLINFQ